LGLQDWGFRIEASGLRLKIEAEGLGLKIEAEG
jgi:hypothetical protein